MRLVSTVLAALLVVAVTVVATTVAYAVLSSYVRARQPRGELVEVSMVARREAWTPELCAVRASLFITCTGPACGEYRVKRLAVEGFDREGGGRLLLYSYSCGTGEGIALRRGLTRLDVVGYHPCERRVDELVVSLWLCGPGRCVEVVRSASLG